MAEIVDKPYTPYADYLSEAAAGESIEISSIGVVLSVDEVYADALAEAASG